MPYWIPACTTYNPTKVVYLKILTPCSASDLHEAGKSSKLLGVTDESGMSYKSSCQPILPTQGVITGDQLGSLQGDCLIFDVTPASVAAQINMPPLAGKNLPAPTFFETHWEEGQVFEDEKDDPDRVKQPWEPPSFVLPSGKDPVLRRDQVRVEDLGLTVGWARVIAGVFTQEECSELITRFNNKGFTPALINISETGSSNKKQQYSRSARDGFRTIVESTEVASWMLEVLRPWLPQEWTDANGDTWQLASINERLRALCYVEDQHFVPHYDAMVTHPPSHPHAGDSSFITCQIYLNDVPEQNGGATTFLNNPGQEGRLKCQPGAGSVLLFTQNLFHEGSRVTEGLKYTIRSDVMFTLSRKGSSTGSHNGSSQSTL